MHTYTWTILPYIRDVCCQIVAFMHTCLWMCIHAHHMQSVCEHNHKAKAHTDTHAAIKDTCTQTHTPTHTHTHTHTQRSCFMNMLTHTLSLSHALLLPHTHTYPAKMNRTMSAYLSSSELYCMQVCMYVYVCMNKVCVSFFTRIIMYICTHVCRNNVRGSFSIRFVLYVFMHTCIYV
jgi:hypothetical protein